jgi:hypothetical protein
MNNTGQELLSEIKDIKEFIKQTKIGKEKLNQKASIETMLCYCLNSTLGISMLVWIIFVFLFGPRFVLFLMILNWYTCIWICLFFSFHFDQKTHKTTFKLSIDSDQIVDFKNGSLSEVYKSLDSNQFTFIYLYAHWCARSTSYIPLVEKLASLNSNEISFLAVDCFNPDGECRKTLRLLKYPQVAVQIRNVGFYSYNGPFELNYLTRFINEIKSPLKRIDSLDEFIQSVLKYDVNILQAKLEISI